MKILSHPIRNTEKPGTVTYANNPSSGKVERAGSFRTALLDSMSEARLGYIGPVSNQHINK